MNVLNASFSVLLKLERSHHCWNYA